MAREIIIVATTASSNDCMLPFLFSSAATCFDIFSSVPPTKRYDIVECLMHVEGSMLALQQETQRKLEGERKEKKRSPMKKEGYN